MTKKVGRKPHSNKIKELEKLILEVASILRQTDSKLDRYGNAQRKLSEDIDILYEITESNRKRRKGD